MSELKQIEPAVLEEAKELAYGTEVLPSGLEGLAQRIQKAKHEGRPLRVKFGIDPTFTELHIGHTVVIRKLRQFQDFGHQVVIIIGNFTAQIGDPSGRDVTRPPLSAEEVNANAQTYLDQIGMILDLKKTEIAPNADWLAPMSLNEVIKLATSATVNQLIAKEAFGTRIEKQLPVSLHELIYPLLVGYDSVAVKADIEFGGTDQRFNVLHGRAVQTLYGFEPQLAMFMPLLEGTDGEKKMSKSYGNYIALKDTPADMFGKCMRIPDNLIVKYFQLATTLSNKEVLAIADELKSGKNPKDAKLRLAEQIVSQYHGKLAAELEVENWDKLHSQRVLPDVQSLPKHDVEYATPLFRVLVEIGLAAGTGEAKRLISEGGVKFNGKVVPNPNVLIGHLCHDANYEGRVEDNILQVGRRKSVALSTKPNKGES